MDGKVCGHEQQYMSVAGYGGWQEFPMRCLECPAEWDAAGRCYECGAKDATPRDGGEMTNERGEWVRITTHFCDKCWKEMNRPEMGHCAKCGRWVRVDHAAYVEVDETPDYDPYWGPQPSEPNFELRCPAHRPTPAKEGESE